MKTLLSAAAVLALASGATAQETRELGAHEHGHSTLDIAFEGDQLSMDLKAPGADIIGFEYKAETDEDRAGVEAAMATLSEPLSLFVMPEAAGCAVTEAQADLVTIEEHVEGEDHAEGEEEEDHAEEAGHAEFQASYRLTCDDPGAIDHIEFAFFEAFPNAEELEIQLISDTGSNGFEVTRDDPTLDLSGQI